ncbi:DUF3617 family protein [Sphingomonas sp. AOB5]|uniref:DUF3617 domain-containing protein n=1 Tax=Sphingomonas sp. AOB5 TaxID=3034017 RepID=UPI0023F85FD1|nr:DUF3617 family protein [Sphingomonas sp. AOB5]MDF7776629.1 DUF3617 family protein [Sphingomonas sp. AOB5]
MYRILMPLAASLTLGAGQDAGPPGAVSLTDAKPSDVVKAMQPHDPAFVMRPGEWEIISKRPPGYQPIPRECLTPEAARERKYSETFALNDDLCTYRRFSYRDGKVSSEQFCYLDVEVGAKPVPSVDIRIDSTHTPDRAEFTMWTRSKTDGTWEKPSHAVMRRVGDCPTENAK